MNARARAPARKVRLRPAVDGDLAAIHLIEKASFADPWSFEAFRDTLGHPRARLEVAEDDDGSVLGYAVAWCVADEAEIANLAVAPDARRRGVATLLLDRILEQSAALGAHNVFLEVRESNVAAQRLYETRGFELVGRRKQYYRLPQEDALLMRRTL